MAEGNFPILGRAEILSGIAEPLRGGGPKNHIRTYEEAKRRLLTQLEATLSDIKTIPAKDRLSRSVFFCADLDHEYIAKSYFPRDFFDEVTWKTTGSLRINQITRDGKKFKDSKPARRIFMRATEDALHQAYETISKDKLNKNQRDSLIGLDAIHIQKPSLKQHGLTSFDSGLLELIFHPMIENEWQECQDKLYDIVSTENYPNFLFDWIKGGGHNMPRFVPVQANSQTLQALSQFNPVRAIRLMPKVSYPRATADSPQNVPPPPKGDPLRSTPLPAIGVFDGGVDLTIPHLGMWVTNTDLTTEPVENEALMHGTAVCGAALYGSDLDKECPQPKFEVKSFRVFPIRQEHGFDLDLYKLVDQISDTVRDPNNEDIKTYVLSFGPRIPIDDNEVDLFTSTLDQLAYQNDILFVVAAGNDGNKQAPFNRIQPPADVVNGLGIGAYVYDIEGRPTRANYSCVGPGRCGNAAKPDIHMFGGDTNHPFKVFVANQDGSAFCMDSAGTSYAAPLAGAMAGHLLHRIEDESIITPQTAKALMIHNAFQSEWEEACGWGPLNKTIDQMLTCNQHEVTLIYNGEIPLKKRAILHIPIFQDIAKDIRARIMWTIAYASDVVPTMPDEYTLGGTNVVFRPHCETFRVNNKKVVRDNNPEYFDSLVASGKIKPTMAPISDQKIEHIKRCMTEEEARDAGKWDTVMHFWTKEKPLQNLKNPTIDIHAIPRADWELPESKPTALPYACVVTIKLNNPDIPLYQRIVTEIPALVPVRLRSRAKIRQRV
jgi:hypothetical protein